MTILLIVIGSLCLVLGLYVLISNVFLKTSKETNWQLDDAHLSAKLTEISKQYHQPAMACALVSGNEIVAKAAVGTIAMGEETSVDGHSRFHIGSTTKTMTALLIALLVREGKLRYDMTLSEMLPDVKMLAEYQDVTLHDLLLHKAGIIAFQLLQNEPPEVSQTLWTDIPARISDPQMQRLEVAKYVLNLKPIAEPGTKAIYSNVGYALIGLIAETAAGKPYETLISEKIFNPLGMVDARFGKWPASISEPNQPRGHYANSRKEPIPQELEDAYVFPDWMNPSGGVHCTINDLALYVQENLLGLQGTGKLMEKSNYENIHIIHHTAVIKEMYPGLFQEGELTLGYGWAVIPDGDKAFISMADGSGGTFYATLVVYPALNIAFAGFTNCGGGNLALSEAIEQMTGFKLGN